MENRNMTHDETGLCEALCAYLNGFEGRLSEFMPETFTGEFPQTAVLLLPETEEVRYVDGTLRRKVPFEVRVRINGFTMREKLTVHGFFAGLAGYLKQSPLKAAFPFGQTEGITPTQAGAKVRVSEDGGEEYRMGFAVLVTGC